MPAYKPLQPYFDAVKDLLAKHDTLEVNPKKGDALLTGKGYKKDAAGYWANAAGERLKLEIIGFGASGSGMGPVLSEMLKRRGIDASLALPPDFDNRFQQGKYTGAIYGHGGSINEPYATLRLYQGSSIAVPGGHQANFARWKNADYDKIVDEMFVTDPSRRGETVGAVAPGDGDLAARPAGHPAGAELPPHRHGHHILEELADRGKPLRQRRALAPDLPDGAVEPADRHDAAHPSNMQAAYIARRFGVFLLIVWLAATLNFFLPKISGQDPVRTKLLQQAALGGAVQAGMEEMVKEYNTRFGLDRPLLAQYGSYLYDTAHLDFNYSIANYPRTVSRTDRRGAAVDRRAACHHHAAVVRHRHACWARCWPGRGSPRWLRCADAAALGAARHPVLSVRPDPDLPVRLPGAVAADVRRLQPRRGPGLHLEVHQRRRACTRSCRRCRSSWCRSAAGRWPCAA